MNNDQKPSIHVSRPSSSLGCGGSVFTVSSEIFSKIQEGKVYGGV